MSQQQFEGLLRHALTLAGAIVLVFFSGAENLVGEISASIMMLGGIIWSWVRKPDDAPLADKITGLIRHSVAIVSSLLVYFGKADVNTTFQGIVATLLNLLPFILSFVSKKE